MRILSVERVSGLRLENRPVRNGKAQIGEREENYNNVLQQRIFADVDDTLMREIHRASLKMFFYVRYRFCGGRA